MKHRSTQDMQMNLSRRQVNALLLWAALASGPTRATAQPTEPPYRVMDFDWVDQARSRPVPARLYWPTVATSEASVPLVVFSHGIGGSRQGYSYLGKHWSTRGVASLHVQHVGSDAQLWRGNPFGVVGRLQAAAQEKEAIARAADVRFALDRMLSDETGSLGAAVNRQRLVAAGHSYGANTTLLTIGAQIVRNGLTLDCLDSRFSAAVVISAPPFYGEPDLAAVLGKVSIPTIHVTATEDVIEIPGYRSGVGDRLAVFDAITNPHKLLAVFQGGSHSMFTDRSLTGGPSLNPKVKVATADLALAFFDLIFEHDGTALARWQTTWQSILARAPRPDSAQTVRMTRARTSPSLAFRDGAPDSTQGRPA
ncbi:alpha/beta hydrolase family protein [Variovorax sp.]|jgi:dienelactone hydrolase|uniref:alpha/beta hydrolase family protein n=1 Tax=Variovorax sp. TaxID=1871043 RepID=UPI0037D9E75C